VTFIQLVKILCDVLKVYKFSIYMLQDKKLQNCNFVCCLVWVRNLTSHSKNEHWLGTFGNRVLRLMFGPYRRKQQENGENFMVEYFMVCSHQILFGR